MATPKIDQDTEEILLTPLFLESQQSQAFLLHTQDTLEHSAEQSRFNKRDAIESKDTDSAFCIRQSATICDSNGLSAANKEDSAYIQWSFEILMLLFAGAIFMTVCVILGHYDDQVLPDWKNIHITLNTVISILATILRVTIAYIALEVLAQLKWEWLSNCFRPLNHVQLFDAASRGIYGCCCLIPTIARHEPFAVAAIAIAVLSLGIGSFTQQSIQTYQCLRNATYQDGMAIIRIANTVHRHDLTDEWVLGGKDALRMNLRMQVTIQDAIVNRVQDYHLAPLFECSSGNCTFQNKSTYEKDNESRSYSHASLGVCNSCVDIYKLVSEPTEYPDVNDTMFKAIGFQLPFNISTNWKGHGKRGRGIIFDDDPSLPVMATTTVDNYTWALDVVTPEFLRLAQMSIVNFTILAASQNGCKDLGGGNVSCPHDCSNRGESTSQDGEVCLPRHKNNTYSFDPLAVTCTLYPCLKYYTATVKNARIQEKVVQEVPLELHGRESLWEMYNEWMEDGNASLAAIQQPCRVGGVFYDVNDTYLLERRPGRCTRYSEFTQHHDPT
jgi:hypothetical protein